MVKTVVDNVRAVADGGVAQIAREIDDAKRTWTFPAYPSLSPELRDFAMGVDFYTLARGFRRPEYSGSISAGQLESAATLFENAPDSEKQKFAQLRALVEKAGPKGLPYMKKEFYALAIDKRLSEHEVADLIAADRDNTIGVGNGDGMPDKMEYKAYSDWKNAPGSADPDILAGLPAGASGVKTRPR